MLLFAADKADFGAFKKRFQPSGRGVRKVLFLGAAAYAVILLG